MNTESIINGIIAKRNEINDAENKKNKETWDEILNLEKQIRGLAPRINEMFEVAEALTRNGFWLGGRKGGGHAPYFLTDHIDHRIGFYVRHPYFDSPGRDYTLTGYFGMANGGACGNYDLKIDRNGCVRRWPEEERKPYLGDLKYVVSKFDEFETAFYEYAKNPIPRSKCL